ncbi:hypothetical protein CCUS01_15810 [Colletotrichum cuscutae]|uniref:Uncharacterized protein n=1 Tax=Colletotrichum cuscutae TaxID=1209917 RepID=A0AAI9VCB0_9PEZI|nr:hypothetical protein CCUS01_15810 [Colletotrichum cuscutae]
MQDSVKHTASPFLRIYASAEDSTRENSSWALKIGQVEVGQPGVEHQLQHSLNASMPRRNGSRVSCVLKQGRVVRMSRRKGHEHKECWMSEILAQSCQCLYEVLPAAVVFTPLLVRLCSVSLLTFFPFLGALPRKILDSPKVNAEINNNDARSDDEASDKGVGDTFYHSPALAHSSASPELHSLPIHCPAVRIGRQSQHSTPRTNVPQSNPHPTPRPRTTTAPRPKTSPVVAVLPCQTNHLSLPCGTCAASHQAAHAAAELSRARRAHRAALLFASRDPGLYTYSAQAPIVNRGLGPAWPLAGFPSPGPSQHAFP